MSIVCDDGMGFHGAPSPLHPHVYDANKPHAVCPRPQRCPGKPGIFEAFPRCFIHYINKRCLGTIFLKRGAGSRDGSDETEGPSPFLPFSQKTAAKDKLFHVFGGCSILDGANLHGTKRSQGSGSVFLLDLISRVRFPGAFVPSSRR